MNLERFFCTYMLVNELKYNFTFNCKNNPIFNVNRTYYFIAYYHLQIVQVVLMNTSSYTLRLMYNAFTSKTVKTRTTTILHALEFFLHLLRVLFIRHVRAILHNRQFFFLLVF